MDDFNGKFCKNGSFPVIRAVSECFKKKPTTTKSTTTAENAVSRNFLNATTEPDSFEDFDNDSSDDRNSSSGLNKNLTLFFFFLSIFIFNFLI